jgi:hypothetical protein
MNTNLTISAFVFIYPAHSESHKSPPQKRLKKPGHAITVW